MENFLKFYHRSLKSTECSQSVLCNDAVHSDIRSFISLKKKLTVQDAYKLSEYFAKLQSFP
jgi:hypothetical protein